MSIGYRDVSVSPELLARYEAEKQKATGWGKYAKFKQWLHYANLNSWQKQGHHFHYLTDVSFERKRWICTCGLYLDEGDSADERTISRDIALKLGQRLLDRLQTIKAHRSFEDFRSPICALIIDFVWEPKVGDYLWTAYCQECGEEVVESRNEVAKKFVQDHNSQCLVRYE